MLVKEVMRTAVAVDKDITLEEVSKIMRSKKIGSLVYVQCGKLKGIITKEDLGDHFGKKVKLSRMMKTKIFSIGPDVDTDEAEKIMKKNKVTHLPVVENGDLVGIISGHDLIGLTGGQDSGDFVFD